MDEGRPSVERPRWVRIALWGLATRASAWVFVWLCAALAAACVAYGFINARFFLGSLMILAALWYYLAIRWVDNNDRW